MRVPNLINQSRNSPTDVCEFFLIYKFNARACVRIFLSVLYEFLLKKLASEFFFSVPLIFFSELKSHPATCHEKASRATRQQEDNTTRRTNPPLLARCFLPDLPSRRHLSCRLAVDSLDASRAIRPSATKRHREPHNDDDDDDTTMTRRRRRTPQHSLDASCWTCPEEDICLVASPSTRRTVESHPTICHEKASRETRQRRRRHDDDATTNKPPDTRSSRLAGPAQKKTLFVLLPCLRLAGRVSPTINPPSFYLYDYEVDAWSAD